MDNSQLPKIFILVILLTINSFHGENSIHGNQGELPFQQPQDHQGYAITNITQVDYEKHEISNSSIERFGLMGSYLMNRGEVALIFNLTTDLIFHGDYNITLVYPTTFYRFYAEFYGNIREYANISWVSNFYEMVISPYIFADPTVYIYNTNMTFKETLVIILENEPVLDLETAIHLDIGVDCVKRDIVCQRSIVNLDNEFEMKHVFYQNNVPEMTTTLTQVELKISYINSPIPAISSIIILSGLIIVFLKKMMGRNKFE